jgi:hypothetical protein
LGNIHKFTDNIRSRYGGFSSALGAEGSDLITSAEFVDMANYDLVVGICHASGIASDSVVTLAMWQATTSAGGASKTVSGASDTFTSTNTTDTDVLVAQVRGEDLDVASSFQYVGFKLATDNASGTEKVGGVLLQMRSRYKQAALPA